MGMPMSIHLRGCDLTTTEAWRLAGPVLERLISAMAD